MGNARDLIQQRFHKDLKHSHFLEWVRFTITLVPRCVLSSEDAVLMACETPEKCTYFREISRSVWETAANGEPIAPSRAQRRGGYIRMEDQQERETFSVVVSRNAIVYVRGGQLRTSRGPQKIALIPLHIKEVYCIHCLPFTRFSISGSKLVVETRMIFSKIRFVGLD